MLAGYGHTAELQLQLDEPSIAYAYWGLTSKFAECPTANQVCVHCSLSGYTAYRHCLFLQLQPLICLHMSFTLSLP